VPWCQAAGATAPAETSIRTCRVVPVAFPLSADWTGSPGVHIGEADRAKHRHVATLDPATGMLTALRPGTVTLAVTVNGTTRQVRIEVSAGAVAPAA